jgi:hypothetical protein
MTGSSFFYLHTTQWRYESFDASCGPPVFPLEMYAVVGDHLGEADHLPIIRGVGEVMSGLVLVAWAAVVVAMMFHLHTTLLRPRSEARR